MSQLDIALNLIFLVLYSMFGSFKWASIILLNLSTVPIGGLIVNLFVSIILLPVMYVWFARRGDHLPHAEMELAEE